AETAVWLSHRGPVSTAHVSDLDPDSLCLAGLQSIRHVRRVKVRAKRAFRKRRGGRFKVRRWDDIDQIVYPLRNHAAVGAHILRADYDCTRRRMLIAGKSNELRR